MRECIVVEMRSFDVELDDELVSHSLFDDGALQTTCEFVPIVGICAAFIIVLYELRSDGDALATQRHSGGGDDAVAALRVLLQSTNSAGDMMSVTTDQEDSISIYLKY